MRWEGRRKSDNVVDRRRARTGGIAIGGGLGGVVLLVLYLLLGGNPSDIQQNLQLEGPVSSVEDSRSLTEQESQMGDFVAVVLAEIEDVWGSLFQEAGMQYREPHLVLFTGQVESACGYAAAAMGPFYCPGDENVYIDLAFFEDMQRELGAPGDFALAYVIAHEVGHHVQNLLGIMDEVQEQRGRVSEREYNQLTVRLELQADFLAGVWAHYALREEGFLDAEDIEEGINAAAAVGDDRIMRQKQGYVVPDAFTHGTSEQRVRWFTKGMQTGDPARGDTFGTAADQL